MPKTILFYSTTGNYGCFSNFSKHPIELDGRIWPTTEHYFQAKKFEKTPYERIIRKASSPSEAARLGRSRKYPLRDDWEEVKEDIMYRAVLAKFTQHEDIQEILLNTEDATLVEHTKNDRYWADGGSWPNGPGLNRLGYILEKVRDELKN